MRIISGIFKGKKINLPKDIKTRPLKDLTKESIFNIIKHTSKFSIQIEESEVLDLFSGTGSFGIECLSRGAKYVTFVENYERVLPILKKNLQSLNSITNFSILEKDILNHFNFKNLNTKFDIIFLDPPYKQNEIKNLIELLISEKVLKKSGIVIIHRHKKHIDSFPRNFKIFENKIYGKSKILFGTFVEV